MPSIQVFGGEKLQGQLKIQGSKNGSLPILAATILNRGNSEHNISCRISYRDN